MSCNYQITPNLRSEEVACPCCNAIFFDRKFVEYLQILRDFMQIPFVYAEGGFYRCRYYNDSLNKSSPNSKHLQGKAADIKTNDFSGVDKWKMVKFAQDLGMSIGIYSAHIHIDLRIGKPVVFHGYY